MGLRKLYVHATQAAICAVLLAVSIGCQVSHLADSPALHSAHPPGPDMDLQPLQAVNSVDVVCAAPENWRALPPTRTLLYIHQQWRSPSKCTGVGVACIHLPFPVSAQALIWLAKIEYSKTANDGRLIAQWTDAQGRPWFEAQNKKYHVRGYAVTRGLEAWIIYTGYKVSLPPSQDELAMADRSMQTILPGGSEMYKERQGDKVTRGQGDTKAQKTASLPLADGR